MDEFIRQRDWLRDHILPSSKSSIHLSFDGWTAPNNTAYLDVVGHFMGVDNNVRTVLLGIRRITGSNTLVEVVTIRFLIHIPRNQRNE